MNGTVTAPLPGTLPDPKYPDSDGRPMGDTGFHNLALTDLRQGLEDHFAGVAVEQDHPVDAVVAANLAFKRTHLHDLALAARSVPAPDTWL
jgi:hypothetical protein